jgi:hypothetical protein
MNIDKIITESINKVIAEVCEVDNAPNGWTDWATTDAANGLTPEEGKAMRMQPGNAARANGGFAKRDFNYPTTREWKEKYPNMSYGEYCYRIYGVKLR